MPRLNNSTQDTVAIFGDLDTHNWDDPGANPPFDFCFGCWLTEVGYRGLDDCEIDHPPYEDCADTVYRCITCGNRLTAIDDDGFWEPDEPDRLAWTIKISKEGNDKPNE